MLCVLAGRLTKDFEYLELETLIKNEYQQMISDRITFISRQYSNLRRMDETLQNGAQVNTIAIPTLVSGLYLSFGVIAFIFSDFSSKTPLQLLVGIYQLLVLAVIEDFVCSCAQEYQDRFEKVYLEICKWNYCSFNVKNMRLYALLLTLTQTPPTFNLIYTTAVSRQFELQGRAPPRSHPRLMFLCLRAALLESPYHSGADAVGGLVNLLECLVFSW
ncbi:uncharacterized protein LOC132706948 [Cylas formicarius]|uniref:uncharacterized protein LOC132706948 n=1 Tax=Cylas formicarius TaxID=197179 RepID=UPI0029583DB5|nr:uncharacterized protein LOC132706948 [Cylas formicarius]